jgi:hypothetical protein
MRVVKTVEAIIDEEGRVRLLEDVKVASPNAYLAERALEDWNRPEEDAAWFHLQPPAK